MHWTVWTLSLATPLASSFLVYYLGPPAPDAGQSKHPLAPSDATSRWFFPLAWTLLYTAFGLALALTLRACLDATGKSFSQKAFLTTAVALFIVNLCLNYAYLVENFRKGDVEKGQTLIVGNLTAAVALTIALAAVVPLAAAIMLPYVAYLFYAWRLQSHIARDPAGGAGGEQ